MSEMASPAADLASDAHHRKLAAILFADVVGYSRLMCEDETATYDALKRLRRTIDPLIADHAGRIVSTAGDGLFADFRSVVDAFHALSRCSRPPASSTRRRLPTVTSNYALGSI